MEIGLPEANTKNNNGTLKNRSEIWVEFNNYYGGLGAVVNEVQTNVFNNKDDADPAQLSGAQINNVLGKLFLSNHSMGRKRNG